MNSKAELTFFSRNLRSLMREQGINARELSEMSGVRESTIRNYMSAKYLPSFDNLHRLENALNCTTDDLYYFYDERPFSREWYPSKKYEDYELNVKGQIRNAKTGKILKTQYTNNGYEQVCVRKDGKQYTERIHRLMADTFMDGLTDDVDIYHADRSRANNHLENLRRCTKSETSKRGFLEGNRKGRGQVKVRCKNTGKIYDSIRECAKDLGISQSQICKCVNGAAYKAGGMEFERVE